MSSGVGQREPDVLLVAEQLRRVVPGGIGTYVRGLLRGLAELDEPTPLDVVLLASRVRGSDPLPELGYPLELRRVPSRLLTRMWSSGLGRRATAKVVHATSFVLPPSDAPLVVTVHDLAFRSHPEAYPARGRAWHERALAESLRRAAAFVVPSETVRSQLVEAGAEDAVVHVIEEGSDHLGPPDEAAAAELLGRLDVVGDFLLAVGTLEPRKNLVRLLAAYDEVREGLPSPWPLLVVGPSGWGSEVLTAPTGVLLAGHVSEGVLSALYRAARLVCYVPLEEGFGLPVAEAMRAGTPVLSSEVPAAAGATELVDPTSVSSIGVGLLRAASDEARRGELVAAGNERAGALTWRRCAEGHIGLWRALIGVGAT